MQFGAQWQGRHSHRACAYLCSHEEFSALFEQIDKDGELFTSARHIAIDSETIQNLIDRADWNASVRELWEKDKPASKLGTGTSASTEESGESKE